jgi:hypothetical protein
MISPQMFSQVTLDPAGSTNDYPRGYQVFVSDDAVTWSQVASGTGAPGMLTVSFPTQTARFVGVVQTGSASNWWSIGEMNVYGPGATPSVLLSSSSFALTASSSGSSDVPARAMDGALGTRWSTGVSQTNGQWLGVDMQQSRKLTKLVMDSGSNSSDYARGYAI